MSTLVSEIQDPATKVVAGSLDLIGVEKAYDLKHPEQKAVEDATVSIPAGTFVTLLGPSGCGKTTTLRMIAGFEDPTAGDILVDGQSVVSTSPEKRPMSMVFQSYALFPHLTVKDNVAYGLKIKKIPKQEREAKVRENLEIMGITQFADRYPHQLSGGQQQRVALARALVMEPKIVLFDEPLSNLDARLRIRMRDEIRSLQQRLGLTAVFVTHDQSEAMTLSDMVVVMSEGRIEQIGSPSDLYHHPINHFVASFFGTSNFVDATVIASTPEGLQTRYEVESDLGPMTVAGVPGMQVGDQAEIMVRRDGTIVVDGDAAHQVDGTVVTAAFDGAIVNYTVATSVGEIYAQTPGTQPLRAVGQKVGLSIPSDGMWLIPAPEHADA